MYASRLPSGEKTGVSFVKAVSSHRDKRTAGPRSGANHFGPSEKSGCDWVPQVRMVGAMILPLAPGNTACAGDASATAAPSAVTAAVILEARAMGVEYRATLCR